MQNIVYFLSLDENCKLDCDGFLGCELGMLGWIALDFGIGLALIGCEAIVFGWGEFLGCELGILGWIALAFGIGGALIGCELGMLGWVALAFGIGWALIGCELGILGWIELGFIVDWVLIGWSFLDIGTSDEFFTDSLSLK